MTLSNWSPPPTKITQLPPGNGPYLSLACHRLQSRRHRALLGLRGSLLAGWSAASERHAMLAKDQPTCFLSSPQTAVPSQFQQFVVNFLGSRSVPMGLKWFVWKRLNMRQWPSFIICHHLSIHIACPSGTAKKCGDLKKWPAGVFVYDARSDNQWIVGISSIFPNILHYITLHYTTLHYIHTCFLYIYILSLSSHQHDIVGLIACWMSCQISIPLRVAGHAEVRYEIAMESLRSDVGMHDDQNDGYIRHR